MHIGIRGGRVTAGLVAMCCTGALLLPAPAVGVAPSAGDPVDISVAAERLADIRSGQRAAAAELADAERRMTEARDLMAAVTDEVEDALAVDRATKRRAAEAAEVSRKATTVHEEAQRTAVAAEGDLRRMARNAYINSLADSDLALFAAFASDGPDALAAMAQRDMAVSNLSDASLVEAQQTVKAAQDTRAAADQARSEYEARSAEHEAARETLTGARSRLRDAEATLTAANADRRAAETQIARSEAAYEKAQAVYKVALRKSLAEGGPAAPISSGPAADVVWRMMREKGFSEESIAGILGNFQQESGVDPTATQAGGPGRGLAQWSQGGRWDNGSNSLLSFAAARGWDPWDARTQVEFMVFEMENVLPFDTEMFKEMTDIVAATVYFHDIFEASADSDEFVRTVRGNYALQWYERLS